MTVSPTQFDVQLHTPTSQLHHWDQGSIDPNINFSKGAVELQSHLIGIDCGFGGNPVLIHLQHAYNTNNKRSWLSNLTFCHNSEQTHTHTRRKCGVLSTLLISTEYINTSSAPISLMKPWTVLPCLIERCFDHGDQTVHLWNPKRAVYDSSLLSYLCYSRHARRASRTPLLPTDSILPARQPPTQRRNLWHPGRTFEMASAMDATGDGVYHMVVQVINKPQTERLVPIKWNSHFLQ